MKRRQLLGGGVGVVAGAALSGFPAPAISQNRRRLTMVTTWPRDLPGLGSSAQRFAERIDQATSGRITIDLYAAGELVPAFDSFDAVSKGEVDLYHGAEYYWESTHPAFNFFAAVPLGFTADEHLSWLRQGEGQRLWDELSAQWNIKPLLVASTGPQMFGWFKQPLQSVDDLLQLTIRMPGLGGRMLDNIGAKTISVPGGDILDAMTTNRVDAAEWIGPWNDLEMGLHNVAKYYYYPGIQEPGTAISAGFNKTIWDSFTREEQILFEFAAEAETAASLAEYALHNARATEVLVGLGVQIRQLDRLVFRTLAISAREVVRAVGEQDNISRTIFNSVVEYRRQIAKWSETGQAFYVGARERYL